MKTIAVDIDGILCKEDNEYNFIEHTFKEHKIWYNNKKPIYDNIDYVNSLYNQGYIIKLFTARDEFFRPETEKWMSEYGVLYNVLVMNKIFYDVFIDDKAVNHINDLEEVLK